MQPNIVEATKPSANVFWCEEVQVRWVGLWVSADDKPKPILQAKAIWNGADECAAGSEEAMGLPHERFRVTYMLEELANNDYVEALVMERKRFFGIGPNRHDAELRGRLECLTVDVNPDHVVAGEVPRRQCTIPTPDVEHPPTGPTDVAPEELRPLLASKDELPRAMLNVVFPVAVCRAFEPAHGGVQSGPAPASAERVSWNSYSCLQMAVDPPARPQSGLALRS
jgi:hypothetical protein